MTMISRPPERAREPEIKLRRRNMKSLRWLPVVLMLLSAAAFAQSDAQKTFDQLKTLAGTWKGPVTATPPQADWDNKPVWVSLRVTSRGNALVHEMKEP